MAFLNPYLNFNGNTEEAFNFYKSVFGGEFDGIMRFSDIPSEASSPETAVSESEGNLIMHVALPLSGGSVLMGSDRPPSYGIGTAGDLHYISIQAESKEEAARLFNGLAEGGQVIMPLDDAFWGDYFGMLKDRFDVQWMVSYEYPKG
jgi:PhnB protein